MRPHGELGACGNDIRCLPVSEPGTRKVRGEQTLVAVQPHVVFSQRKDDIPAGPRHTLGGQQAEHEFEKQVRIVAVAPHLFEG
jgi:hypothetical protein